MLRDLELLVAVLIVLVGTALAGLAVRNRVLHRSGATVDCSLRSTGTGRLARTGKGWRLGVGRYDGDALRWFPVFALSLRARVEITREGLALRSRRTPAGQEAMALQKGVEVVELAASAGERYELAMSPEATLGLVAWIEGGPRSHP